MIVNCEICVIELEANNQIGWTPWLLNDSSSKIEVTEQAF